MNKKKRETVRRWAASEKNDAIRLAQAIWELAEPPFHEVESSRLLADYLTARGFTVTWPFRAVPTAFKAEKGSGKPVLGFLGEYDGLPDCGLRPGTYGHGCGHNLLGVGTAVAAVTTAALIDQAGLAGTVQYWGCPAADRSLLNAVRAEFETATQGFKFDALIPKSQRPPQLAMHAAASERSGS